MKKAACCGLFLSYPARVPTVSENAALFTPQDECTTKSTTYAKIFARCIHRNLDQDQFSLLIEALEEHRYVENESVIKIRQPGKFSESDIGPRFQKLLDAALLLNADCHRG